VESFSPIGSLLEGEQRSGDVMLLRETKPALCETVTTITWGYLVTRGVVLVDETQWQRVVEVL